MKPGERGIKPEGQFAAASTATLTASTASISTSTVSMADKDIRDEAPNQVDNSQVNSIIRTEYIQSETGTVQKEIEIDKNNSVETGLMTSSQHIVSKTKGIRPESRRPTDKESLERFNSAVEHYDELAIIGVTSSRYSPGHLPSSVTDINSSSSWIVQQSGGWLQLDLGSRKNIHRVSIAWSPHSFDQRINFVLSVSEDGISFSEKRIGSGDETWPTFKMYHLPQNTYGRYIRITIKETTGDDRFGISGIILYGCH